MNTIETQKSQQNSASKKEAIEAQKAYQAKEEEFRRHRDEMSRLLLSDYIDNALAQLCAVT